MKLGSVISSALYQGSDTQWKWRTKKVQVIFLMTNTTLKQVITWADHSIYFLFWLYNMQPTLSKAFSMFIFAKERKEI